MAETRSPLERLVDIDFSSDPRRARFELPGTDLPAYAAGEPSVPLGRLKVTREIAYDLAVHRIYREEVTPRDIWHDLMINRDPSINEIKKWARDRLLPGKWNQATPNGLHFTPDGYVLGGQHRILGMLYAFQLASREGLSVGPFSIPVVGNVPWESFSTDDTGLPRQPHQFLKKYSDPRRATMTLRFLAPMLEGLEKVSMFDERADIDKIKYLDSLFPEMSSGWFTETEVAKKRTGIPAKILLSHMIAAYRAGAEYSVIQEFLNPLMNSEIVLQPSDPRDRLRTHVWELRNKRNRNGIKKFTKGDEVMYTNLVRYALRNFLDGSKLDRISATSLSLGEIWHGAQLQQWYKEASA